MNTPDQGQRTHTLRPPEPGDQHYPFYRALLTGKRVWRDDKLNKVQEWLTLSHPEINGMSMEDVELVINVLTRRGYVQVADPRMPTLKRDHWSNAEVCALLESVKAEGVPGYNDGLEQAQILFGDMASDPATVAGAKALDTATGRVVCVGPRLPQ